MTAPTTEASPGRWGRVVAVGRLALYVGRVSRYRPGQLRLVAGQWFLEVQVGRHYIGAAV
jgi:hypothetical protein